MIVTVNPIAERGMSFVVSCHGLNRDQASGNEEIEMEENGTVIDD